MSGTIIYQKDGFRLTLKKHYTVGYEEIPVAVFYDDDGNQAAIEFEHLEGMFAALVEAGAIGKPAASRCSSCGTQDRSVMCLWCRSSH